jgi:hypothetical protein
MIDLFVMEQQASRINDVYEATALVKVLMVLKAHAAVALVERMNTGVARIENRFIRVYWPGCFGVLGQLRDGRFSALEVNAPDGKLRPKKIKFLERIHGAGGVGFVVRGCWIFFYELEKAGRLQHD